MVYPSTTISVGRGSALVTAALQPLPEFSGGVAFISILEALPGGVGTLPV